MLLVIELGWTPEKMKTWWNRVMVQTKKPNTFEEEQDEQGTETPNEARNRFVSHFLSPHSRAGRNTLLEKG